MVLTVTEEQRSAKEESALPGKPPLQQLPQKAQPMDFSRRSGVGAHQYSGDRGIFPIQSALKKYQLNKYEYPEKIKLA
jgi:hypothetical protein